MKSVLNEVIDWRLERTSSDIHKSASWGMAGFMSAFRLGLVFPAKVNPLIWNDTVKNWLRRRLQNEEHSP